MIMENTSTSNVAELQSPAYALMKRGKRGAAALIAADCCSIAAAATAAQQQEIAGGDTEVAGALIRCKILDNMLDVLLNPYDAISEWNNLDWLRWLMAGGKTLDEFSSAVKDYDYGTCCGLVWTANYVAYRCRTCSISPCMSLCGDCFKRGDHTGHDFNMFRSQAGGACDCGDTSVMKPEGFCRKHSSTNNLDGSSNSSYRIPPADLLRVAERIMPRLLLRLVQYLRENSKIADSRPPGQHVPLGGAAGVNQQPQNLLFVDLEPFLAMLHDLSALGAAMRRVMTVSLTSEKIYSWACDYYSNAGIISNDSNLQQQTIYTLYTDKMRRYYAEAVHQYTTSASSNRQRRYSNTSDISNRDIVTGHNNSQSNSEEDDDEFGQDDWLVDGQNSSGKNKLNHSSFLQEIVFWTVRYEFPQKMVCLLLNMLPDATYKEALTEAFVMHYGCVARVLATTRDSDTLSNHIVHISVQLFSNEALATRMVDKLGLLRVMVSSLKRMMTKILIPSTLHDPTKIKHRVVDCSKAVMKEHCYWPLVSDLNNVLSHRSIAIKFMCDDRLLDSWFSYLSMFQGMNVNCRELEHHVEFEPNTYYAAFSAELEASAYPMWAMLSHLTSAETWHLASHVLRACLQRLRKWLIDVGYYNQCQNSICSDASTSAQDNIGTNSTVAIIRRSDDRHQFTFHLPLHRYLAVFLCQAVRAQGARVEDVIPYSNTGNTAERDALLLAIAAHPVRAQAAFYEIMQGAWVRNGLQIKGQAMTYIQSNFCISMVDADIYLLQLCLSELSDANIFMSLILEKFKVYDWMHVVKNGGLPQIMDSQQFDAAPSMESLLVFLATLVGVRTNLCSDEHYDYCQSQLEIVTLLSVSDKTHSQLMELMPERCGGGTQTTTSSSNPSSHEQNCSPRDFETVLQAVAEYKRPQFEASGNMQQGLYVPLAHVWKNLYDPVHVLLRAVHRRDFQASMDRYTAFMRSIGMLKPNQTPWPPYRTPQQHHLAYRNPCRALLSKLFHAVVWHCLYRSTVYRDIGEHTLSLLVYLLDQAWTCYNDSSIANDKKNFSNLQQQPMDTDSVKNSSSTTSSEYSNETSKIDIDDKICPKRRIKITAADASCENDTSGSNKAQDSTLLLLDRWYSSDDLSHNLCTTITHIELPPPYYHYFFSNIDDTTNTTTSGNTTATNLLDFPHNMETGNSQPQQPINVPSLAVIARNEILVAASYTNSALNQIKQFLCPNTDTNNDNTMGPTVESNEKHQRFENDESLIAESNEDIQQNSLVSINESIISLLLRLHSNLSGKSDSYEPPSRAHVDEVTTNNKFPKEDDEIPCGDGAFYVGRLLDKIVKGSASCYECVLRTRLALWPQAAVLREAASREDEERERNERKRRVLEKQKKMMKEMEEAQKAFLKSAYLSGDLVSTDKESPREQPVPCTTTNSNANMDYDDLAVPRGSCNLNNSSDVPSYSPSSFEVIDKDESSNSSNSTTATTKETAANARVSNQQETPLTVDCVICNQTSVVHLEQQRRDPVGLVILVQGTNVLAHRRHIVPFSTMSTNQYNASNSSTGSSQQSQKQKDLATAVTNDGNSFIDEDELNINRCWPALPPLQPQEHPQSTVPDDDSNSQQLNHQSMVTTIVDDDDTTTYASHSDRRKRLMIQYFHNLDKADFEIGALTTTTSATPIGGNVHVQTCGHHLHLRCWSSYLSSLRTTQRFNSDKGEYSCPLCRQLANSLMPLIPAEAEFNVLQQQQHRGVTSNSATAMTDIVNEMTELIKEQESTILKPISSNSCISSGESSMSVTPRARQITITRHNAPHTHAHHQYFLDDSYLPDHIGEVVNGDTISIEDIADEDDPLLNVVNKCVIEAISTTAVIAAAHTHPLPPSLLTPAQKDKGYKVRWYSVVSVAWTNIQVELVQRNNCLLTQHEEWSMHHSNFCHRHQRCSTAVTDSSGGNNYYNMLPKRNCIAPLLKVLRVSAQCLMKRYPTNDCSPVLDIWYKLIGIACPRKLCNNIDPPLLMRDPCTVLLQLVLLLPNLERDFFDTLVKLTYNMQLFAAALKVAITWNQNHNFNRYPNLNYALDDLSKPNKMSKAEETNISDSQMDVDHGNNDVPTLSSSMDIIENRIDAPTLFSSRPVLFSEAVTFAKTIVFLSQDDKNEVDVDIAAVATEEEDFTMHHDGLEDNDVDEDKLDVPSTQDDEENMQLLESYGRRCTLPFLRFAALLKKYTNEDGNDSLDDQSDILSSLQQSNINIEHNKPRNLDSQHHHTNYQNENLSKNSPYCCHQWSRDDYEFLVLARYLKLLNYDEEAYKDCDNDGENLDPNSCKNNADHNPSDVKKCTPLIPPSAMEAVLWPQWSYSTTDVSDNVATTISRVWLTSFRETLSAKIPPMATIVSPADINPNSNANITIAARLLLAIDCCAGGVSYNSLRTSENTDGIPNSIRCFLPTVNWTGPRLLKLPHLYDDVFQYYHGRPCHRCQGVPRETSVCLVCGTVVCLKENCCKNNGIYEAVQHSLECGGSTGMFLGVTSSSVIVIRGKRACLWGSVYLDAYGEEDRELKRGKPLYLSVERYRLLERQWLAHRFDHTNKKWVWHRDAL